MKFFKKKKFWIWSVILLVILGFGLSRFLAKEESNYVTEKVIIGDLTQTVEISGSVRAAEEINLSFGRSGTLREVNVKVGDQVEAGQVLASLSAGAAASQVADAQANVSLARANLAELLAGASAEDIRVTEQELASAQTSYQAAQDSIGNLQRSRDQEMETLRQKALAVLTDKLFVVNYSLNLVSQAILSSDAQRDLYVSDITALSQAKSAYQNTNNLYQVAKTDFDRAQNTRSQLDILTALDALGQAADSTAFTLSRTFEVMQATIVNGVYTTAAIENYKSSINVQSSAVGAASSAITAAAADIRGRDLHYKNSLSDAQNSLELALMNMNLIEARLELKKSPPRDFQIEAAQARVRQAEASLSRVSSDYNETILRSPVDGVVTKADLSRGEQALAGQSFISIIGLSEMEIRVDVPESDIVKLKIGDEVEIILDAFSSQEKFAGIVTFIDPASTRSEGVVYFRTTISFAKEDERIKPGMTADLRIRTDSRENVVLAPSRSVIFREDKRYIQVLENGQLAEKEVVVGLRGDGGLVEIISGVKAGEEVITYIRN
ncbi:MAG: efflux RND transporter periplasmic adaptor subunit [Patescibacteria group bacterium]|nr:efflux RND transporter periplasmic adaptor subunit [Patescibacteria group bacterium]